MAGSVSQLPDALLKQLREIVESHKVERVIGISDGTARIEAMLNEQYGMLFINRIDGRVFPAGQRSRVTTCTLTFAQFRQNHHTTVQAALAVLEPLLQSKSG